MTKRRTPEQWQTLFADHQASGLTQAEFCKRQGLTPKYFSLRRRQLIGAQSKQPVSRFIQVQPTRKQVFCRGVAALPRDGDSLCASQPPVYCRCCEIADMIQWAEGVAIYLHRDPVDFRKSINGLSVIVDEAMGLSPFAPSIFVFCNRRRDTLKVLYWDKAGFALWYKRLEKEKFKWPHKHQEATITVNHEQWDWLLRGLNFLAIKPHQNYRFSAVN